MAKFTSNSKRPRSGLKFKNPHKSFFIFFEEELKKISITILIARVLTIVFVYKIIQFTGENDLFFRN